MPQEIMLLVVFNNILSSIIVFVLYSKKFIQADNVTNREICYTVVITTSSVAVLLK